MKEKTRSGHGDCHKRKLTPSQVNKVRKGTPVHIRIGGVSKKVTKGNLRGNQVEWYKRSDTKKPALRNYKKDHKIKATKSPSKRKGRGFEGD